jgi:hypothetical protein
MKTIDLFNCSGMLKFGHHTVQHLNENDLSPADAGAKSRRTSNFVVKNARLTCDVTIMFKSPSSTLRASVIPDKQGKNKQRESNTRVSCETPANQATIKTNFHNTKLQQLNPAGGTEVKAETFKFFRGVLL